MSEQEGLVLMRMSEGTESSWKCWKHRPHITRPECLQDLLCILQVRTCGGELRGLHTRC